MLIVLSNYWNCNMKNCQVYFIHHCSIQNYGYNTIDGCHEFHFQNLYLFLFSEYQKAAYLQTNIIQKHGCRQWSQGAKCQFNAIRISSLSYSPRLPFQTTITFRRTSVYPDSRTTPYIPGYWQLKVVARSLSGSGIFVLCAISWIVIR